MEDTLLSFKVGDFVRVGSSGQKGRISDITHPIGTFKLYTVQLLNGGFLRAGRHELVKGEMNSATAITADDPVEDVFGGDSILEGITPEELDMLFEQIPLACAAPVSTVPGAPVATASAAPDLVQPETNQNPTDTNTKGNRFVSPVEIDSFIAENENQQTKRKTLSHQRLLETYLKSVDEQRPIHVIPPTELNQHLCQFFLSVRQKNGREYEPVSLRSMLGSIERYLKRHNYSTSVIGGHVFAKTREVLKYKQKELKSKGYGNKPKTADSVSDTEIELLYEREQLGPSTPTSLLNTMWLNNTLHFGIRGGASEHRPLCWGDVKLCYDSEAKCEYLEYNERLTKTRHGDPGNAREVTPKMFATNVENRCPIEMYKLYAQKRPQNMKLADSPFYLGVVTNNARPSLHDRWYLSQPVGINKLKSLMKSMAEKGNLPNLPFKRLTNTSVRKRSCQLLMQEDVPDAQAIHVTGHKNPASLNNYRAITNHQQRTMSNILARSSSSTSTDVHDVVSPPTFPPCKRPCLPTTTSGSPSLSLSQSMETSVKIDSASALQAVFKDANIYGGTFNINVQYNTPSRSARPSEEE